MTTHPVATRLIALNAVQRGTFTLASGATSDIYVDARAAAGSPGFLDLVGRHMAPYALGHDAIAGVVLGGVPHAVAAALTAGKHLLMVRPEPKTHGRGSQIEGAELAPGARVLVIEDVATSGTSLLKAIQVLREKGYTVANAACVVDRGEGARKLLGDNGVALHALTTLAELRAATQEAVRR